MLLQIRRAISVFAVAGGLVWCGTSTAYAAGKDRAEVDRAGVDRPALNRTDDWCYEPAKAPRGSGGERVAATDFGMKPNSFENASAAIRRALDYCKGRKGATLVLPAGRIDLWPEGAAARELYISNGTENDTLSKIRSIAFLLDGFENFTVEGSNTLVVLHEKMISFAILNSSDITFRDMSFDYERPTMSELTIRSVGPEEIQASVHPDSRYHIDENGRINWYGEQWKSNAFHTIVFDSVTQTSRYSNFAPFLTSTAVTTGPLQLSFKGEFSKTGFHPGNVLTIRDPYRDNAGAFINGSRNIRLESLHMRYMHGLGIVSQFSENISLVKVKVAPAEGSGRVVSSFADCFHFSGCKGLILIDSCFTSGAHDDPVNVHGTHLAITAPPAGHKVTVRFMHHQTYRFAAFFSGDSIAFINPHTLLPKGYGRVRSARLVNKREMEVELEDPLPSTVGKDDCLENITWTPEVIIRNSRFERTNTRGILVTTRRKVLIEGNTFFRTGMHAILIADDARSWYESGPVQDVTIRNNRFEECGYNSAPANYIINIAPENDELVRGRYVHRNIRIEDNLFKVYDTPLLMARSVDGLVFRNNIIQRSDLLKGNRTEPSIKLVACNDVVARDNSFPADWKILVVTEHMQRRQLSTNYKVVQKEAEKKGR